MALMLAVNNPVSQSKPKAEPLANKESPPPAPLKAVPQPQPRTLHQADTFVSAPTAPKSTPTNVAAGHQSAVGWSGDASVVRQDSPTGCGTANLAQICDAACGGPAQSPQQHRQQVASNAAEINNSAALRDYVRVDLKDGATPNEMAALLGKQGQKVVRGFDVFDSNYVNGALQQGQFGLTLLDSNVLRNAMLPPEKRTNEPGALHWVTVDGIDNKGTLYDYSDDLYRVKDPIHGAYWVPERVLRAAVAQAREHTGSGGVLIIENERDARTKEAREALALQNLDHTAIVGNGNGIGSKPTSVIEPSSIRLAPVQTVLAQQLAQVDALDARFARGS